MTKSVYVTGGGGLGDLIYNYFCKSKWKLIEPVKKAFPEIRTVGILTCHATPAHELIELNPYVDIRVVHPWYRPGHEKEKMWKDAVSAEDIKKFAKAHNIKEKDNTLYLSDKEKETFESIASKPYIAMHPFAGLPHRGCMIHPETGKYMCFPDYKYIELARELRNRGYRIVILGFSDKNVLYPDRRVDNIIDINEPPDIINLVNKNSLRLSVQIARMAKGFVGSHSSMLAAAWTNHVPSVYFYPNKDNHGNHRTIKKDGGETGTWQMHQPYHFAYELEPDRFEKLEVNAVADKLEENINIRGTK